MIPTRENLEELKRLHNLLLVLDYSRGGGKIESIKGKFAISGLRLKMVKDLKKETLQRIDELLGVKI